MNKSIKNDFNISVLFMRELKETLILIDYEEQAILYHLPKQQLLFLGLNSSWQLDHHYTSRASIHTDALSNALTQLRQHSKAYEECFKFAVWHHPLNSPFEDRITDKGFIERLLLIILLKCA